MKKRNDGGSAFPEVETDRESSAVNGDIGRTYSYGGMTLRDYFAGQALVGILSHPSGFADINDGSDRVRYSYELADKMIAEREKDNETNKG